MSKICPCQTHGTDCCFPDCYTKDELFNVIEKKNTRITELEAAINAHMIRNDFKEDEAVFLFLEYYAPVEVHTAKHQKADHE